MLCIELASDTCKSVRRSLFRVLALVLQLRFFKGDYISSVLFNNSCVLFRGQSEGEAKSEASGWTGVSSGPHVAIFVRFCCIGFASGSEGKAKAKPKAKAVVGPTSPQAKGKAKPKGKGVVGPASIEVHMWSRCFGGGASSTSKREASPQVYMQLSLIARVPLHPIIFVKVVQGCIDLTEEASSTSCASNMQQQQHSSDGGGQY
eukprot:5566861-Amphidinium_carterae.1